MRRIVCTILTIVACGAGTAHARNARVGLSPAARLGLSFGTVGVISVSPGTISFNAANPDSGTVSGTSLATISWQVMSGSHLQNWSLSLQALSASFVGCSTIPVSAVQVSCSSASVSGGGGTGSCGGSLPLSTSLQQIAGGAEGDNTDSYTVYLNFTLAESWRYVANSSCTITLTYSVNAQ